MLLQKHRLSLLLAVLLLIPVAGGLRAQDLYRDARTSTVGLRLYGGTSWSFGSQFENVRANQINLTQPYAGAGLLVNIRPWVRIGADYSYTRMIREQLFTALQPDGAFYRDFKTHFHAASLTGEFNLMEIAGKGPGRFGLWVGTGLGYLFAQGNTWTMSAADASSGTIQAIHFGGHNDPHRYNSLYIPATLSLEYAFLPEVSLSVGGGFRYLFSNAEVAPKTQAYATVGLVFNLTGKARRAKPVQPVEPVAIVRSVPDTVYVEKIVEKVVEKVVEVPVATVTDDMLPYVTFERGFSNLDERKNAAALSTLVSILKANPSVRVNILGWTDHTGGDHINGPLSTARATVLRDYLVGQGIDASRFNIVEGRGKYPATGEEAFSVTSRRAEAVLPK